MNIPLDSPWDVRNNIIILKRLPIQIILKIENQFGDKKYKNLL